MKVAISTDGDLVSAHFGRCHTFTIVDITDGKASNKETVVNPGHQPGAIPQFLHEKGVQCIICGGMGQRAVGFFNDLKIRTLIGVSGTVDDAIESLKKGTLKDGESLCKPGAGKGYGVEKTVCDHPNEEEHNQ